MNIISLADADLRTRRAIASAIDGLASGRDALVVRTGAALARSAVERGAPLMSYDKAAEDAQAAFHRSTRDGAVYRIAQSPDGTVSLLRFDRAGRLTIVHIFLTNRDQLVARCAANAVMADAA